MFLYAQRCAGSCHYENHITRFVFNKNYMTILNVPVIELAYNIFLFFYFIHILLFIVFMNVKLKINIHISCVSKCFFDDKFLWYS